MGDSKARMKGLNKLVAKLRDRKDAHAKGFEEGVKAVGRYILDEAKDLVPVEFGDLYNSGYHKTRGSGFRTQSIVGFSDPKAIYVHEDMSVAHGFRFNILHASEIAAGTESARRDKDQAKFLETAYRRGGDKIVSIIVESMNRHAKQDSNRG